tara:strand:- start:192 stop:416 length:225 start_codon:yes stop_codon:yes gene_type:complete
MTTKRIKLSNVKAGNSYKINYTVNHGGGSGSQSFYSEVGKIKEVNPEFIRVYYDENSRRSFKIMNKDITDVFGR